MIFFFHYFPQNAPLPKVYVVDIYIQTGKLLFSLRKWRKFEWGQPTFAFSFLVYWGTQGRIKKNSHGICPLGEGEAPLPNHTMNFNQAQSRCCESDLPLIRGRPAPNPLKNPTSWLVFQVNEIISFQQIYTISKSRHHHVMGMEKWKR